MSSRNVRSHLHGQMHGSTERRRPERSIIVPSEQLHPPDLPRLTKAQGEEQGLITSGDARIILDWPAHIFTAWVGERRFEPVAHYGRTFWFLPEQIDAAIKRWGTPPSIAGRRER